jgi:hypothetical protein
VTCSEVEEGQVFDEALTKDLTGDDRIESRRMREDFWSFQPTHKLFLAGNHKPSICGDDEGIWRRIRLVPWNVVIPEEERDPELPSKLRAELPGDPGALRVRKGRAYPKQVFADRPGALSGIVVLRAETAAKRAAYDWRYSVDGGHTWLEATITLKAKATVSGLTPGATVGFRRVPLPRRDQGGNGGLERSEVGEGDVAASPPSTGRMLHVLTDREPSCVRPLLPPCCCSP